MLANIIAKSVWLAKTTLKLLWKTLSGTDATEKLLIEVYTCQVEQTIYLQEEFAAAIVRGTFDENTSKIVRILKMPLPHNQLVS